jgi:hypothetical protein
MDDERIVWGRRSPSSVHGPRSAKAIKLEENRRPSAVAGPLRP